jgi:hypothetical protein
MDMECTWCGGKFVGRCRYCGRSFCEKHRSAPEHFKYVYPGESQWGVLGDVCADCRNAQLDEEQKKRDAKQAAYWAHMPPDVRSQLSAIPDPIERLVVALRRYWVAGLQTSIYRGKQPVLSANREAQDRGLIQAAKEVLETRDGYLYDSVEVARWWARKAVPSGIPFTGSVKISQPRKGFFGRVGTTEAAAWVFPGGSTETRNYYDVTSWVDAQILSDGTILSGGRIADESSPAKWSSGSAVFARPGLRDWTLWRMGELLGYKAGFE